MSEIKRQDVIDRAVNFANNFANQVSPYHNQRYPANCNVSLLGSYENRPAVVNGFSDTVVTGGGLKSHAVNICQYYSRVVNGRYGLRRTGYSDYTDRGTVSASATHYIGLTYAQVAARVILMPGSGSWAVNSHNFNLIQNIISGRLGGRVPASEIQISGGNPTTITRQGGFSNRTYVSGNVHFADRRTGKHLGYAVFTRGSRQYGSPTSDGNGSSEYPMISLVDTVRFVEYTPAPTYVAGFSINDAAPNMANHRAVTMQLAAAQLLNPVGGVTRISNVDNIYNTLWNLINSRKNAIEVDLTVCHNSYVAPPHSSRGRR